MTRAWLACTVLAAGAAGAADPGPAFPEFRVERLAAPLVIDGRLDEPLYDRPPQVSEFKQIDPVAQAPASERTDVWVAYDDDFLYVGARLHEAHPDAIVRNTLLQQTSLGPDDRLVVVIDTFDDRQNGYFFEVNANGQRADALLEVNNRFLDQWEGIWYAESRIGPDAWTTEIAIPFKTLSFDPNSDTWGVNFLRDITHTREFLAWSTLANQDWNIMPRWMGRMRGFENLRQGAGLDIKPSLTVGRRRNLENDTSEDVVEPSLDAFYKFTPSLTGALTLNTDFSATEVDDRQINFDRFSLFFPEKRSFFLQDAGIFEFGGLAENGRPFFSRTIGLSADGEPIDIDAGAKLTGRVNRWNLGMLGIRQGTLGELDADTVFVGRTKYNIVDGAYVGAIATLGDPSRNGDASTIGLDARYQARRAEWQPLEAEAWVQQTSREEGGVDTDGSAWGGAVRLPHDKYFGYIEYARFGEGFDPAMGFVNRTGIHDWRLFARFRHRPRAGRFLAINHWVWLNHVTDLDGSPKTQFVDLTPVQFFTRTSDLLDLRYFLQREVVDAPFDLFGRITVQPGDYRNDRAVIYLETASQRDWQARVEWNDGDFFGGTRTSWIAGGVWKPSPNLRLDAGVTLSDVEHPAGDFFVRLYSLKKSLALSRDWAWITLAQFDNVSERVGVNTRLRWIPRPGQEYFVVVDHGMLRDGDTFRSTRSDAIIKLATTLRF